METAYYAERHGYNSRLDEVQAAILSLKLPLIEGWIARRREIASRYTEALAGSGLVLPKETAENHHVYYLYVVEHPTDRDGMLERLAKRGVNCNVSYRWPIHTMRGYAHLGYREGDFPVAEAKAKRIFSLPMYPYLTDEEIDTVIDAVKSTVDG
jgi:aminotransferase EvaB